MKKRNTTLLQLLLPLLVIAVVSGILLLEKRGIFFDEKERSLEMLPALTAKADTTVPGGHDRPMLLLVNEQLEIEAGYVRTMCDTLDAMRIPWEKHDVTQPLLPSLASHDTILICTQSMLPMLSTMDAIVAWLEGGGRLGLCMSPIMDDAFFVLYRLLGIVEYGVEYIAYEGFRMRSDLLPLLQDYPYRADGDMNDFTLPVRLEEDCLVHMESLSENPLPLLWARPYGDGRVVVFNTTLMSGKDSRGLALAVLAALEDTLIYPIINAGAVFIDDFPAPQPEGFDDRLLAEYGYDIQGFFRHHWWPDMKQLAWNYGVAYSGVLIETYNDQIDPPFEPEEEGALLRFYASELLHSGGEIGLHGYNHMSLNFEGFVYPPGVDYKLWPSEENMTLGLQELYRYGKQLFPDANFQTYVPPSNFLSPEGQAVLRKTLPEVRVISGLYLREAGVDALVQEFGEESDGSISVPRLSSGFIPSEYNWMVIASELAFHGMYSHFIHPDDVLDEARGATSGWAQMYARFSEMIDTVSKTYPPLRFATAAEAAAAVQRYERLGVARHETDEALEVKLSGLHDTAWLALRCERTPGRVTGGTLHRINGTQYWLEATEDTVRIEWEGTP